MYAMGRWSFHLVPSVLGKDRHDERASATEVIRKDTEATVISGGLGIGPFRALGEMFSPTSPASARWRRQCADLQLRVLTCTHSGVAEHPHAPIKIYVGLLR